MRRWSGESGEAVRVRVARSERRRSSDGRQQQRSSQKRLEKTCVDPSLAALPSPRLLPSSVRRAAVAASEDWPPPLPSAPLRSCATAAELSSRCVSCWCRCIRSHAVCAVRTEYAQCFWLLRRIVGRCQTGRTAVRMEAVHLCRPGWSAAAVTQTGRTRTERVMTRGSHRAV